MARAFEATKRSTLCPYAAQARISYGPAWCDDDTKLVNWDRIAAALAEWATTAEVERSHGFVVEIGHPAAGNFDHVRTLMRGVLQSISERDPALSTCMSGRFEDPEWQFEFAGLRLFVNLFAPCYPPGHGKHTDTPGRIYLFLQPEYAFDLCGITPENRAAKERVRRRFREAGSPYNGEMIDGRLEAYLYMFPLKPTDEPVKWW